MMGTSTKGPITAANAAPELIPKTAMATAIANSKLLLDAVKDKVQQRLYSIPILIAIKNVSKNITTKKTSNGIAIVTTSIGS